MKIKESEIIQVIWLSYMNVEGFFEKATAGRNGWKQNVVKNIQFMH